MTPKVKKILIITIPVFIVIIILTILIALYMTTDFLKSNDTLFFKYASQNVDAIKMLVDNTNEKEYTNLLRQGKYESESSLSASYTEKLNTSEENKNSDINKLKFVSENQTEYLSDYEYKNMKILYNDTDIIRAEYIHDNEIYGVRFPDRFNQFFTVENHNLKNVASNASLTEEQIKLIPDTIERIDYNSLFSFTDEELATLQQRYLGIISDNVSKDNYSKQDNALVTVGEQSFDTTAYSITVTKEQANSIYIKMLEQLKNDEIVLNKIKQFEPASLIFNILRNSENAQNTEFLQESFVSNIDEIIEEIVKNNIGTNEIKYTVYVSNGTTIRTQILEETKQTTIDFNTANNNIEIDIQQTIASEDQENEKNIKISKNYSNEKSEFSIKIETKVGEEKRASEIYSNRKMNGTTVLNESGIEYQTEKNNLFKLKFNEEVELNNNFDRKIILNEENSVVANKYEKNLVTTWVNDIKEYINKKVQENKNLIDNIKKVEPVAKLIGEPTGENVVQETNQITEVDKNRFNAKFEFYTGKEKSYEDVVQLLEEAKNSLKGVQVSYSNNGSSSENKKLQIVRLNVEEGNTNAEIVEELKNKLEQGKKYTIELTKNSNDTVETVIISVNG